MAIIIRQTKTNIFELDRIKDAKKTILELSNNCPPFNIEKLVSYYGYRIIYNYERYSLLCDNVAQIKKDGNNIVFYISKNMSPERIRFALAHLLAHALINPYDLKNIKCNLLFKNSGIMCQDANKIALDLIIPDSFFHDELYNKKIKNIIELSDIFEVTSMAIKYKAYLLGILKQY